MRRRVVVLLVIVALLGGCKARAGDRLASDSTIVLGCARIG